jgi:hypothetical protein
LKANGGALPGWIVGTAGAVRYRLPDTKDKAKAAETDVYGYLLGTVHPDGKIDFEYKRIEEKDAVESVKKHFGNVVHACFAENKNTLPAGGPVCTQ